jgi:hypothetical protein
MRSEVHEVSSQRERRSLPFGRYDRVLSSPKVPLILALGALLTVGLLLGAGPGPFQASAAEATTWYVDWEAAGANNGTSWTDAFVDLQLALDAATEGDQIWVAEGTYYPSVPHGGSGDRYKSFQMVNGVGIYGGFDPSTGDIGWDDRDWVHHEVVLSGDIGVQGNDSDNCYHVFSHPATLGLDNSAILDGFTVTRGNADDPGGVHTNGGGMRNVSASPTLANCAFELNKSFDNGAGIYNESSSPVITNCA